MAKRPQQEEFDRDILDIIPERYDADEDSYEPESGSKLRSIITIAVALFAVGFIVVVGWRLMGSRHLGAGGSQVIKADEHPIKIRPDDRGGMQVPNQDKLVYGRMENEGEAESAKTERLLAPPEEPKLLPRPGGAENNPPPMAAPIAVAPAPVPVPVPPQPQQAMTQQPIPQMEAPPIAKAQPPAHKQQITSAPEPAHAPAPAPVVAAPAPAPKAATPPPAPVIQRAVAEPGGGYVVQLGAVRSADAADKEWSRIQHANASVLAGLKPDIIQVDIADKGTFWRIRAGSLSEQGARALCQELTSRSQGCIIVRK